VLEIMVIITARVRLQSGRSEEFIDAVRLMKPKVMHDPGAIQYSLHRSPDDPSEFIFYEQYESEAAFAYHLSSDHFKAFAQTIEPLFEVPGDIGKWTEVL
jgi:quinol monooxygenase YgiN